MPACVKCGNSISEKSAYEYCLRCGHKIGAPVEPGGSRASMEPNHRNRAGLWAVLAAVPLFLGTCAVAQTGIGVDRPYSTGLNAIFAIGVGLLALGVLAAYRGFRHDVVRTILTLVGAAVLLGPCGAFYLSYNTLPPFQTSDASGAQYALHRGVPGEVRYASGYTVAVSAPSFTTDSTSAGGRVWVIPVRFSNEIREDSGHVGRCSLYVDGNYRDPHRERDTVRALGDVDRRGVTSFAVGDGYQGRVAFDVPGYARQVQLQCFSKQTVPVYFDLTPFATAP